MPDSNGTLRTSADNIAGFPDREISVAPCRAIRRSLFSFSLYLPRRAPFELLSPLGVVIFSKGHVEQLETAHERRSMRPRRAEALMILKWMRVMCRPFRFSPLRVSLLSLLPQPPVSSTPSASQPSPPPRASDRRDSAPSSLPGSLGLGYLVSSGCLPLPVCPPASPWNCFLL